ncbi:DUF2795 domain-containing protein [Methanolobus halotolerans]|uniref:DUF2795 domain-containing protein n=1 Tax=Methanolobus halotolerans TaxID=2052935 RepID=A0A4E0PX65_9EURY|nr:DUF2795 domain-containing protein [Methanolobus halotolerans]TGC10705.1 hypothetical protein CUN85_04340 [Methanolobus halotolerans]
MRSNATAVQEALEGIEYPKNKRDILDYAKKHHASENIISDLQDIPDKKYESTSDIRRALGVKGLTEDMQKRIEEDVEKIDKDIDRWTQHKS